MTDDGGLLLFTCTYGTDAPERATVPFIAASAAVAAGKPAAVVCTAEAVWLGTRGGAGQVAAEDMPALQDLYEAVVAGGGGEVWLCSACTTRRGITEDQLADGARIVGAVQIVEALSGGKAISLT